MIAVAVVLIVLSYITGRLSRGPGPHILLIFAVSLFAIVTYMADDELLTGIPAKEECMECDELSTRNLEYIFGNETRLFTDKETRCSWESDRELIGDSVVGRYVLRCLQNSYQYVYSPGRGVIISKFGNGKRN